MDNTVLHYNNSFCFSMKQSMENMDDLLYNLEGLKQLQCGIDKVQELKDDLQLSVNMVSLTYLRKYILDETGVGPTLFRNLIRKYYHLNDNQIMFYENENITGDNYYLTNLNVIKRRGDQFILCDKYSYNIHNYNANTFHSDVLCELSSLNRDYYISPRLYALNYRIDFHKDENILHSVTSCAHYRNQLMKNDFTIWDWELVHDIKSGNTGYKDENGLIALLYNRGFIAQMGIDNVTGTLTKFKEIAGASQKKIDEAQKFYEDKRYLLYSYLSITKDFILEHQDELDWTVLQRNPRISWDLELIKMLLQKIKSNVSESEWWNNLNGSYAMYSAIENYLNDDILSDIEKLYNL
jgi:hypothetical protein